jgi:alpha-glucosidase
MKYLSEYSSQTVFITMAYQEPLPSLTPLRDAHNADDGSVRITDENGLPVEICMFDGIGWSIEVRYDEKEQVVQRQIFTGDQEILPKAEISQKDTGEQIVLEAGKQTLLISKATGKITVNAGDRTVFESTTHPFSQHETPVLIEEGIMSLKVTELSERTPFFPPSPTIATRMVRFQYVMPEGPVLGLPGQAGEMNRAGYRFELFNTDNPVHIPSRAPLYQSWPILFHKDRANDGWLCIFHDNPTRTFVDIGDFYNDVTFESQAGNSRVYIIHGKTLEEVSSKLTRLLGGTQFPPQWAFGYQQCRWSYMSVADLRKVVHSFRDHDIPLDCVYYDIDYMDGFRVFTNNALSFGEMADFLQETKTSGIHSVCIIDPGVKIDEEYPIYRKLYESKCYLTQEDGEPFRARVWAGLSLFPDFGDEAMQSLWSDWQKEWLDRFPFDGVWNDMNEPANFDGQNRLTVNARTKRGPITNEYNLYGYHMAKASRKGMDKWKPGKRTLVITRSGYAGVQKHSIIWHGDNQAWWEHLRLALDTSITYSLAGAYYTGADVPGFNGNPPDDLAVRFYQLGAFMPLFRGHSIYFSKDKEPYSFGTRANAAIKEAIRLRYELLREWYGGFERCVRESIPPLTPVFDDTNTLIHDQFLLFDTFLVAPVIQRDQNKRLIYLPEGSWYKYGNTADMLQGNSWIVMDTELEDIPLFVRAGRVITKNTVGRNAASTLSAPETFEAYLDENGNATGYWFGDDGESMVDLDAQRFRLSWSKNMKAVERKSL